MSDTPLPNLSSDNWAPAHPMVLDAVVHANTGSVPAYGADPYTAAAIAAIQHHLGERAIPFFLFTGTGANVLALGSCLEPYEAVICAETAHIYQDETGAPERHLGVRLIPVPTTDGKLTVESMRAHARGRGIVSKVQPRVVSLSQCTEYGTVYTPDELRRLCDAAHEDDLLVHMDGARLANAAVGLDCSLAAVSSDCGIDVLSLGATKNGALGAEAVVFFDPALADGFQYRRKQGMQLASKMRYLAVQFTALLTDDLWAENARRANAAAQALARGLESLPGVRLTQKVEANEVFAILPAEHASELERTARFHVWDASRREYRFVCSWDTSSDEVERFLAAARAVVGGS